MDAYKPPTDRGPFYLAVSAQLDAAGEVTYRILRADRPGERLQAENAGLATPTCGHLHCRLANLGAAAVDWAYLISVPHTEEGFHSEQMGFSVAPE